jgi:hypothetical protein
MRTSTLFSAAGLVLVFLLACNGERKLKISPDSAGPGESIRIQLSPKDKRAKEVQVTVAGEPAAVIGVSDEGEAEALVPMLGPVPQAEVVVHAGGRRIGAGKISILPTISRRLVFAFEGDSLRLLRTLPSADAPAGHVRTGRPRLSIDLVNEHDVIVHSATVLHPMKTLAESFYMTEEGDAKTRTSLGVGRPEPEGALTFMVDVPNPRVQVRVVVYDVPENVDILTDKGRKMRTRIAQVEVKP